MPKVEAKYTLLIFRVKSGMMSKEKKNNVRQSDLQKEIKWSNVWHVGVKTPKLQKKLW